MNRDKDVNLSIRETLRELEFFQPYLQCMGLKAPEILYRAIKDGFMHIQIVKILE